MRIQSLSIFEASKILTLIFLDLSLHTILNHSSSGITINIQMMAVFLANFTTRSHIHINIYKQPSYTWQAFWQINWKNNLQLKCTFPDVYIKTVFNFPVMEPMKTLQKVVLWQVPEGYEGFKSWIWWWGKFGRHFSKGKIVLVWLEYTLYVKGQLCSSLETAWELYLCTLFPPWFHRLSDVWIRMVEKEWKMLKIQNKL